MATVWKGRVRGRSFPVAVKVLEPRQHSEVFLETFKREVRAMARLDHPGVVDIYDYGLIAGPEADASEGALIENAPFVAMSWANGGTLGDRSGLRAPRSFDWWELRGALLQILDALAHAHARGVVHLDLKPDNVLATTAGTSLTYRLADFGIAHAVESKDPDLGVLAGTPVYMSPEQFRNARDDYGPWTDLYALGCVAFQLAGGRVPFVSTNIFELTLEHTQEVPPALEPRLALPRDFEGWLRWLLDKPIGARPQRAADAATALARLGPPIAPASGGPAPMPPRTELRDVTTVLTPIVESIPPRTSTAPPRGPAAVPKRWQRPRRQQQRWLHGVGQALVGLREHPMVGRLAERQELWERLAAVVGSGEPQLVVLRGSAGLGKSRLARWLVQRAEELGVARGLVASFSPGPRAGLELAVRQLILASETRDDGLRGRVAHRAQEPVGPLRPEEASTLADFLERREVDAERLATIVARLLLHEGRRRPLVWWLDDVQWGHDGLLHAAHLLTHGTRDGPLPLLMVATAREDALGDHPDAEAALLALEAMPCSTTIDLSPLPEADATELMRELLGLDRALADRLAHHTGGHPLFATQLVADLARRGVLLPRDTGYVIADQIELTVPDALHEVFVARLDALLQGRPDGDRHALELAATLGVNLDLATWREACSQAGVAPTLGLVDALVDERLASTGGSTLSFIHGMLVESLLRLARQGARLASHHRACAAALDPVWRAAGDPRVAAALGRHRVAAGLLQGSLEPLLAGAEALVRRGALVEADQLLALRRRALDEAGIAEGGSERVAGEILAARAASIRARHGQARGFIQRAIASATPGAQQAQAILEAGAIAERAGQRVEAHAHYGEAQALYAALGDRPGGGRAALGRGMMAAYLGSTDEAMQGCQEAIATLADAGLPLLLGRAERGLGNLMLHRDRVRARALYDSAMARFVDLNAEHDIHKTLNGLAESHRLDGALETALDAFEALLDRQQRMVPTSDVDLTRFNAGLSLIALHRFDEATKRLAEVEHGLAERPNDVLRTGLVFAWLPCHANADERESLANALVEARAEVEREEGLVEHDDAVNAAMAGELILPLDGPLAKRCFVVALAYWQRQGPEAEAERMRALLATMPEPPSPDVA
jgi:eukaryotic-like serine/threonine-protein kinase